MSTIKKVVLAYSGGLDTSVILKWIQKTYDCEVITVTCDLGQEEELDGWKPSPAHRRHQGLHRRPCARSSPGNFVFPMLRAGAIYEGRYLLGTSIARR
jgi:argininosuccinate synthase